MKTFAELKQGDKIYYWDHGKLHEQLVHSVKKTEKIDEWKDWYGKIQRKVYDIWVIEAGRGSKFDFWHTADKTITRCGSMTRFSCLEAAREWLQDNMDDCNRRADKYKKRYEKEHACAEKYENAYCRITPW